MTRPPLQPRDLRPLGVLLNTLATVQVVWFYLARVPAAIHILAYEQGQERLPFQERVLMMAPLQWAHHSSLAAGIAQWLTRLPGWFPGGVRPEGVAQAVIDLASVAATGIFARRIYQAASATGRLTPFIYPLTLLMITITYSVQTNHALRFLYDFPALAFFSAGLYLIYARAHPLLFSALFIAATFNRETTLLLLPLYGLTQCIPTSPRSTRLHLIASLPRPWVRPAIRPRDGTPTGTPVWPAALHQLPFHDKPRPSQRWGPLWSPRTLAVLLPLSVWWIAWHLWVTRHFAGNPTVAGPRLLLNIETLLCPFAWPQLAVGAGYVWPFTLALRRLISDRTLRAWIWLPAAWLAFMLFYGLCIESRIFGELIPYFVCTTALIAEQWMEHQAAQSSPALHRLAR